MPAGARLPSRTSWKWPASAQVAAALIVDYLNAGRVALGGVMPTHERHRVRAVLRRERRHAARRPRTARGADQPRARPGPAQEVLPQLRLRAAGSRQQRRRALVARPAALVPARGRPRLPALPQRAGRGQPGRASQPDVHGALALEPQPLACGAAPQGRPPQPVQHPAHGVGRPDGGSLPRPRRLSGQRSGRPGRDPRSPARAGDDARLPQRGDGHRRASRRWCGGSSRTASASTSSTPSSRACSLTRS